MKKFKDSIFIYSEWKGYLDKKFKNYEYLQEFVPDNHIYLHTSGYAEYETLKRVCQLLQPQKIIPIHGENPNAFLDMNLENCKIEIVEDGKEIIV